MSAHVRFRVGDEALALPVGNVLEVADAEVTPVPGAPAAVLGVCNRRGQVVPVIELARLLGTARAGAGARVVVTERAGHRAALAIDEATGVEELEVSEEGYVAPFLTGLGRSGDEPVGIVDLAAVYAAVERRAADE
jgi:purine-binding chemotaxis protein CheW